MAYKPKSKSQEPKTKGIPSPITEETLQEVVPMIPEPVVSVAEPIVTPSIAVSNTELVKSVPQKEEKAEIIISFITEKYRELEEEQKTCPTLQHRREVDVRLHELGKLLVFVKTL